MDRTSCATMRRCRHIFIRSIQNNPFRTMVTPPSNKVLAPESAAKKLKRLDSAGLPVKAFSELSEELREAEMKRIKDDFNRRKAELKYGDGW
jgi:hypothetical protein